ncbi:MAG TPA: ATP-binding protein [Polyangiaceae bacterium]|nr:ATP-binding protein [Polyangiaceae bacterium]
MSLASNPPSAGFAPALVRAAERANVGVVVAVPEGEHWRSEFTNQRAALLFGKSIDRVPDDLGLDDTQSSRMRRWFECDASEAPLVLDAVEFADAAAPSTLRVIASRTKIDGRTAAVLFLYDASGRHEAERALAESEARFRRLLDAAPDAIALGTERRIVYANPALVRMLGYDTMQGVIERKVTEQVHPENLLQVRRISRLLLEGDRPEPPIRIRVARSDGLYVPVELRLIGLEWDGERALLGIARDLTERRRIQAQLIRADRLAAMGTLAAGVAHEINNPLAYLMLNLQYVMRELPRFDGSASRLAFLLERLAEAEHGARRVSSIVGDLRTFGRPEQVERGPVSVTRAVASAVKVASTQIRHRARIVESYEEVPLVDGSATRLEQVFVNLLVNAAQAIADGNPDGNQVSASVRAEADRVVVEVSDTGSGIPPDILTRVFDPFFTTKPRGVGTGLGLPISRGIVTALGGEITVSSTVGKGTTFRVALPALTAPDLASSPEGSAPPPPDLHASPGRARVLVVDDEPLVADMLRRALADAHDVTVATAAQTALDHILSGQEFDLIFCDVLMPRMSGMDLYDALQKQRPGMEARIVFMTGGAFTDRAAQFLAKVPNSKMSKPFDLTELERVVARVARASPPPHSNTNQ